MRRVWRSGSEIAAAIRLSDTGHSDRDVARATGIPHETVRAWRSGRVPERARRVLAGVAECDRCGGPEHDLSALPRDAYAYLLGMYLGDGCVTRTPKGSCSLRISLDVIYPAIIARARHAVAAVKGGPLPHVAPRGVAACVVVTS